MHSKLFDETQLKGLMLYNEEYGSCEEDISREYLNGVKIVEPMRGFEEAYKFYPETDVQVKARSKRVIERIVKQYECETLQDKSVLHIVVTHGF